MSRAGGRSASFKSQMTYEQSKRTINETTILIRKTKKEERLKQRRMQNDTHPSSSLSSPSFPAFSPKKSTITQLVQVIADYASNASTKISEEAAFKNVKQLRRLLSQPDKPPVKQTIEAGAVPHLVKLLDKTGLQFEVAWCLTNLASSNQTNVVAESGAVPKLVELLINPIPDIREQAAWCIGNIAGHSNEYRNVLLKEKGLITNIIRNLNSPTTLTLLQNFCWLVSNLCRGKPAPSLSVVRVFLDPLAETITRCDSKDFDSCNVDVRSDAIWALVSISSGTNDRSKAVRDTGVIPKLMHLIVWFPRNKNLVLPTIRCIGNLVSCGLDEPTDAVIKAGFLNHAVVLLESRWKAIRKDACWVLSNIAAGTQDQISSLFHTGPRHELIAKLVEMAEDEPWEVRKEAIWAISNLFITGSDRQVRTIVELDGLRPICRALRGYDSTILNNAMDSIEAAMDINDRYELNYHALVAEYGGFDSIEELQNHPNDGVYEKASNIISTFFVDDDAENENVVPAHGNSMFQFGLTSKELFPQDGSLPNFEFGGTTGSNAALQISEV